MQTIVVFKEESGNDSGRDCVVKMLEKDEWINYIVEGQIKGTAFPKNML